MPDRASRPSAMHRPSFLSLVTNEAATSPLQAALESDGWLAHNVKELISCVGSIAAFDELDAAPILSEPLDWTWLASDVRPTVTTVATTLSERIDSLNRELFWRAAEAGGCDPLSYIDDEHEAICFRLLAKLAARAPDVLARTTTPRTAAAILWLALRGNRTDGRRTTEVTAKEIWTEFGVSSCARHARALHAALGFELVGEANFYRRADIWLASPDLLHSRNRTWLLGRRADVLQVIQRRAVERARTRAVQPMPDGTVQIRARTVTPQRALRSTMDGGRQVVVALFGADDDAEALALSVPHAHRLVTMLQNALARSATAALSRAEPPSTTVELGPNRV
jgi:hypothetical protein